MSTRKSLEINALYVLCVTCYIPNIDLLVVAWFGTVYISLCKYEYIYT